MHWPALCDAGDDAAGGDVAAALPAAVAGGGGGVCAEPAGDFTAGVAGDALACAAVVDIFTPKIYCKLKICAAK